MRKSSIRRCRIGIRVTKKAVGYLQFCDQTRNVQGRNSKISWTQVETGSAITWKYPSCILLGDNSIGEFYSVAVRIIINKPDTGTKMVHVGKTRRARLFRKAFRLGTARIVIAGWSRFKRARPMPETFRNAIRCCLATNVERIRFRISR